MVNLRYEKISQELQANLFSPDDFYNWIKPAIEDIVLRDALPPFAFGHLIGTNLNQWRGDLHEIYDHLSDRAQHSFRVGIANCLKFLTVDEDERNSNDPSKNSGCNVEQLALTYIELIREYRIVEAMRYLPVLIGTKFPKSRSLYDASLLTWRLMPGADPDINWVETFYNERELRFQPKYCGLIAIGMCIAKPKEAKYYLQEWLPLRQFLAEIPSSQNERLRTYGMRLIEAISSIQKDGYYEMSNSINVAGILKLAYFGNPLSLASRLNECAHLSLAKPKRQIKHMSLPQPKMVHNLLDDLAGVCA